MVCTISLSDIFLAEQYVFINWGNWRKNKIIFCFHIKLDYEPQVGCYCSKFPKHSSFLDNCWIYFFLLQALMYFVSSPVLANYTVNYCTGNFTLVRMSFHNELRCHCYYENMCLSIFHIFLQKYLTIKWRNILQWYILNIFALILLKSIIWHTYIYIYK